MPALSDDAATSATIRYARQHSTLLNRFGPVVAGTWDDLDRWDAADVDVFRRTASPKFEAAQTAAIALAAGYLGVLTGETPPAGRRPGIDPKFDDPFIAYWATLKNGGTWNEAKRAGRERAALMGKDTLVKEIDDYTAEVAGVMKIVGWRRVTRGDTCDWCRLVATQRYTARDKAARVRHRACDCVVVPIYGETDPGQTIGGLDLSTDEEAQLKKAVARIEKLSEVDEVAARYGVTADQVKTARGPARQIRADIRQIAQAEADDLRYALEQKDLDLLTRPGRLRRTVDDVTGRVRFRRDQSGYDWFEQLTKEERGRINLRLVDSGEYAPDLLAERVRRMTNQDWTDDEAIEWLTGQWLREDALRSVASGRNPKYWDIDDLLPNDYELEGYRLSELFGRNADEAAAHVAQVTQDQAAMYADRTLGTARLGPAPYDLDVFDYVDEVEQLTVFLDELETELGTLDTVAARRTLDRLAELVPEDIDPDGRMNLFELWDEIRVTATLAGRI